MDVHRDEVGHLKKLITQKDEELQKTVQKYEQVIQVLSEECTLRANSLVSQKWINPTQHLEAISVGSCPLSHGFLWQTHEFKLSSSIAAVVFHLRARTAHYINLIYF